MSRIGKLPVKIPDGVNVAIAENHISVKGKKGELTQEYLNNVTFSIEDGICRVTRVDDTKQSRALHGLYRSLLYNMVVGVSEGFSRTLEINGVGYRAEMQNKILILNLGYSVSIKYVIPEGIEINIESQTRLTVHGVDKVLVGRTAAEIRSLRPPEPYKGKGIKYSYERIRRKVGKSGIK